MSPWSIKGISNAFTQNTILGRKVEKTKTDFETKLNQLISNDDIIM